MAQRNGRPPRDTPSSLGRMSKYSEKVRHPALCAVPDCEYLGKILRLVNARPDWFCGEHALALDEAAKK